MKISCDWLYKNSFKTNNSIIPLFVLFGWSTCDLAHTQKAGKYTSQEDGEHRPSALWLYRWTDGGWKEARRRGGGQTHIQQTEVIKQSWAVTSDHRCFCGVYSARGLLGVICLLACSSSCRVQRKDLTLSERQENITAHRDETGCDLSGIYCWSLSRVLLWC